MNMEHYTFEKYCNKCSPILPKWNTCRTNCMLISKLAVILLTLKNDTNKKTDIIKAEL